MKIYFVDWAHKQEKLFYCDENETIIKNPKFEDNDEVYGENIPWKHCKKLKEKGIKIFRVHGNKIADFRKSLGYPKLDSETGDKNDVIFIKRYWEQHPDDFKEYNGPSRLQILYTTFKDIQKARVSAGNRIWSGDTDKHNNFIFDDLKNLEDKIKKEIGKELKNDPIMAWLQRIKGINVSTAGGLISFVGDIERFNSVSELWSYSGLDVVDGMAPRKRKGSSASCHHRLKSLLLGIIGDSFIKQRTPVYRDIYDQTKERELAKTYPEGYLKEKYNGYSKKDIHLSQGHAHNRAIRRMIKIFVQHFWILNRQLHELPTEPMYVHKVLKHKHYILPPHIPESLMPFKAF